MKELREMDKRIAILKGWKCLLDEGPRKIWINPEHPNTELESYSQSGYFYPFPFYSSDLEDAWNLIKEMPEGYVIGKWGIRNGIEYWSCYNGKLDVNPVSISAPEAIARAWIAWKELI